MLIDASSKGPQLRSGRSYRFRVFGWITLFASSSLLSFPVHAQVQEPTAAPNKLSRIGNVSEQALAKLILPRITFRESNFEGALKYLATRIQQASGDGLKVDFHSELPAEFRPRHELTLDVGPLPALEALKYVTELAGVDFRIEKGGISIRPIEVDEPKAPSAPVAESGEKVVRKPGKLDKQAEKADAGRNSHRAMSGEVQPEKSGYVKHRTMGGWSTHADPSNKLTVNCQRPASCPGGSCGCTHCPCGRRETTRSQRK